MQETDYFINPIASLPKASALWFYCYCKKIKIKTRLEKRKIKKIFYQYVYEIGIFRDYTRSPNCN